MSSTYLDQQVFDRQSLLPVRLAAFHWIDMRRQHFNGLVEVWPNAIRSLNFFNIPQHQLVVRSVILVQRKATDLSSPAFSATLLCQVMCTLPYEFTEHLRHCGRDDWTAA